MNSIQFVVSQDVTVESWDEALATGKVTIYRVRGNGSTRKIAYLAPESKDREIAEWAVQEHEEGRTMEDLASEAHVSVPTLRRLMNALEITEEAEDYDDEEVGDLLAEAFAAAAEQDAASLTPEEAVAVAATEAAINEAVAEHGKDDNVFAALAAALEASADSPVVVLPDAE